MRRGAGVLTVVLAMLSFAASASAAGIDWKKVQYLDYKSGVMFAVTDGSWSNAKAIHVRRLFPPNGTLFIWTRTCTEAAQSVSFSKTILTPGAPAHGTAYLDYGPFGVNPPYTGSEMFVNGILIARIGKPGGNTFLPGVSVPLSARALHAFHDGANKLTIRVQRAALPKGQRCEDAKTLRYTSVVGYVILHFAAGLTAVPSDKGPVIVFKNVVPGPGPIAGATRFMNSGPSASLAGDVRIVIDAGDSYFQTFISTTSSTALSPFVGCNWANAGLGPAAEATCTYEDFKPGEAQVTLLAGYVVPASFPANGVHRITLSWQIGSSTGEENTNTFADNPMTQVVFVLCGPAATDPACA